MKHEKNEIKADAIGVMSGTSLDGLDLAACSFRYNGEIWDYIVHNAITIPYDPTWKQKLVSAHTLTGFELRTLDVEFGKFIGQWVNEFIVRSGFKPGLIASHGHTIFHQPQAGITLQIGSGAVIAALTGISTVSDFRSTDVALGGQGAPLVPIGDELLFGKYDACLNLGGFSNISFRFNQKRIAFDICPVNILHNSLVRSEGFDFDTDGRFAASGNINTHLLEALNTLDFYRAKPPKSLGREWFERVILPLFEGSGLNLADKLRTATEHIVIQLNHVLTHYGFRYVLVTGGGTHNKFLIDRLRDTCSATIAIPDRITIDYKEALVFALLGVLRMNNLTNCFSSATGASADSSGGAVYLAPVVASDVK